MGTIYRRGETWWIQYYHRGKRYRESSNSDSKMIARYLLQQREGDIAEGKIPALVYERTKFKDLVKLIVDDYARNEKKSEERLRSSIKRLEPFFCDHTATEITTSEVNNYIDSRTGEGAAAATINRELSCLKRMLTLGKNAGKVGAVPKISLLAEQNTRQGFFEYEEFLAVRNSLPEYLKGFVTFLYKTGWRLNEVTSLTWQQVDRKEWCVRIEGDQTKNKRARTVYLDADLKKIISELWERRREENPYVFPNKAGTGRISDIRGAWKSACKKAGVNRLVHDLRRSAVRNMSRAGVPEVVAMAISGHKTRSVFDRYDIVSGDDLKKAVEKMEQHQISDDSHKNATIDSHNEKTG